MCAAPFLLAALFAMLLGAIGVIGAAPGELPPPSGLSFGSSQLGTVLAVLLLLVLAWLLWPMAMHRLGMRVRPQSDAAGVAMLLVLLPVCVVVWIVNPLTALLLLPALHLWLLIASPELRPRPPAALALVLLALVPVGLLAGFYAAELGLGPGRFLSAAVLLVAGGHVGVPGALLWSLALGCGVASVLLALSVDGSTFERGDDDEQEITIRGPLSYAGPGSLGGTTSALRR